VSSRFFGTKLRDASKLLVTRISQVDQLEAKEMAYQYLRNLHLDKPKRTILLKGVKVVVRISSISPIRLSQTLRNSSNQSLDDSDTLEVLCSLTVCNDILFFSNEADFTVFFCFSMDTACIHWWNENLKPSNIVNDTTAKRSSAISAFPDPSNPKLLMGFSLLDSTDLVHTCALVKFFSISDLNSVKEVLANTLKSLDSVVAQQFPFNLRSVSDQVVAIDRGIWTGMRGLPCVLLVTSHRFIIVWNECDSVESIVFDVKTISVDCQTSSEEVSRIGAFSFRCSTSLIRKISIDGCAAPFLLWDAIEKVKMV